MPKPKAEKSDKKPKAAGKRKSAGRKSHFVRNVLILALLGGAGYAAFTVRYRGRTMVQRAEARVDRFLFTDSDVHPAQMAHKTPAKAAKAHPVVAGQPAHARSSEEITQADKDALDKLIPR